MQRTYYVLAGVILFLASVSIALFSASNPTFTWSHNYYVGTAHPLTTYYAIDQSAGVGWFGVESAGTSFHPLKTWSSVSITSAPENLFLHASNGDYSVTGGGLAVAPDVVYVVSGSSDGASALFRFHDNNAQVIATLQSIPLDRIAAGTYFSSGEHNYLAVASADTRIYLQIDRVPDGQDVYEYSYDTGSNVHSIGIAYDSDYNVLYGSADSSSFYVFYLPFNDGEHGSIKLGKVPLGNIYAGFSAFYDGNLYGGLIPTSSSSNITVYEFNLATMTSNPMDARFKMYMTIPNTYPPISTSPPYIYHFRDGSHRVAVAYYSRVNDQRVRVILVVDVAHKTYYYFVSPPIPDHDYVSILSEWHSPQGLVLSMASARTGDTSDSNAYVFSVLFPAPDYAVHIASASYSSGTLHVSAEVNASSVPATVPYSLTIAHDSNTIYTAHGDFDVTYSPEFFTLSYPLTLSPGAYTVTLAISPSHDSNAQNNVSSVSLTVSAPPSGGGSAGGGTVTPPAPKQAPPAQAHQPKHNTSALSVVSLSNPSFLAALLMFVLVVFYFLFR